MFEDAEREQFFESAVQQAKRDFEENANNATALVRWGGALLELAHFRQGEESMALIHEAIGKLNDALAKDAGRADANWCLGNAYTSLGFLNNQRSAALVLFRKASQCFKQCNLKEPSNETYKKALEMCDKAPEYYDEIQAQIQAGEGRMREGGGGKKAAAPSSSDVWWDLAGWACLVTIVVGVLAFARSGAPAAKA